MQEQQYAQQQHMQHSYQHDVKLIPKFCKRNFTMMQESPKIDEIHSFAESKWNEMKSNAGACASGAWRHAATG